MHLNLYCTSPGTWTPQRCGGRRRAVRCTWLPREEKEGRRERGEAPRASFGGPDRTSPGHGRAEHNAEQPQGHAESGATSLEITGLAEQRTAPAWARLRHRTPQVAYMPVGPGFTSMVPKVRLASSRLVSSRLTPSQVEPLFVASRPAMPRLNDRPRPSTPLWLRLAMSMSVTAERASAKVKAQQRASRRVRPAEGRS